jgi:hypothetical protein
MLTSILKTAGTGRIYAMHMPTKDSRKTFFEWEKLTSAGLIFISSSQVDISPHMYNRTVPKWPLEVSGSVVEQ